MVKRASLDHQVTGSIPEMLAVAGTTAMLQPVATDLYEKAGAVDSAERMLGLVRENGAGPMTIIFYEEQLASARQAYKDAVLNVALAAGATTLAVTAAVVVCSPGLLLPTL